MNLEMLETGLAVAVSYIGNPLSMWLAIHRKPFGWWIVAGTQLLFVSFAITSGDWRFGGQVLCLAMGVYGVWLWQIRREHEPAIGRAADRIVIKKPGLYQVTTGMAIRQPDPRAVLPLVHRTSDPAAVERIAEDAMAALNHFDRQQAAELRERLEATR